MAHSLRFTELSLPSPRIQRASGGIGLTLFALSPLLSTAGIYISLALMALALAFHPRPFLRFCRQSPLAWGILILTGFVALRTFWATQQFPQAWDPVAEGGKELLLLTGIPALALAWHLGQDLRRAYMLLAMFLFGLIFGAFYHLGWDAFWTYLTSSTDQELFFGGQSNLIGTLYANAFLASLVLGFGLLSQKGKQLSRPLLIAASSLLVVAGAISLLIVFWNQSRTVWVALSVALLFLAVTALPRLPWAGAHARATAVGVGLTLLAGAWITFHSLPLVEKRVQAIAPEIKTVTTAKEVAPVTAHGSFRIRYWMARAGWEAFQKRPIFGWGPDNYQLVVKEVGHPDLLRWEQIHTLYIQLAVEFGIVGLAGFALILGWAMREFLIAYRDGTLPGPVAGFVGSAWVYFLVLSLAHIRHDDPPGKAYLILITGLLLTGPVTRKIRSEARPAPSRRNEVAPPSEASRP